MKDWLSNLKEDAYGILGNFVEDLLKDVGDAVWDATWEVLIEAIVKAEKKWDNGELIGQRKKFVIDTVLNFIESKQALGWIQGWMVRAFLSTAIDKIIAQLNTRLGNDWVKYADKLRDSVESKIKWLDAEDSKNDSEGSKGSKK